MATSKFGREPKEMTTEPSADELKHEGMKKGGHAHKKHMAMGGNPMMAMPQRAMAPRRAMAMPPALLRRKDGGKAEERKEMKEMHKIEKELKRHEKMKDSTHGGKAHMAKGGKAMYTPQIGGLLGEGKPHHKASTGAIEGPGYKHGGKAHHISGHPVGSHEHHKHMAKHHMKMHKESGSAHHKKMHEHHKHMAAGGTMPAVHHGGEQMKRGGKMMHKASGGLAAKGDAFQTKGTLKPKIDVQDKVVEAKQTKSFHTKSGGIEGVGYKHGGKMHKYAKGGTVSQNVANRYLNDMKDGEKMPTKKGKTGEIHQAPAGYKSGGHVTHGHKQHHTTHGHDDHGHKHMHHMHGGKHEHGHTHIDHHPMKHGGHAKHHSKISTHHKKGGKCNY